MAGRSFPPAGTSSIHRLALVGNVATAVGLLAVFAALQTLGGESVSHLDAMKGVAVRLPQSPARLVVLVVIDGLRLDVARDPRAMPTLARLASEAGASAGVARVEAVVPSTVAAVMTLATGRVPPPDAFLEDFQARPSLDGGIFAAVAAAGGRSFAAGPRLWADLFGRWVDTPGPVEADDEAALRAGLDAIAAGRHRLVVVHLQDVDEAAHRRGVASAEHDEAARRADAAVDRLRLALPADGALAVTSDHGNIDPGGHAGVEPEVVATPWIALGPGLADEPPVELRQRDIPARLARALGVPIEKTSPNEANAARPSWAWFALPVGLACGVWLWASACVGGRRAWQAFWLNLAIWPALGLALLGMPQAGAMVLVAALLAAAAPTAPADPRAVVALGRAILAGATLGMSRLAAARWGATWPWSPSDAAEALGGASAAAALLALLMGVTARSRLAGPWSLGVLAAVAPVALMTWLGRTLSLSTVDVRAAHLVIDLPAGLGLTAAVGLTVLSEALPGAGLALGLGLGARGLAPPDAARLAGTMAAAVVGQAVPMALVLAIAPHDLTWTGLAFGGLLRALCESLYLLLPFTVVVGLVGRPAASTREAPPALRPALA